MQPRHLQKHAAHWAEGLLWFSAVLCLGCISTALLSAASARGQAQALLLPHASLAITPPISAVNSRSGSVIGRLEIPDLKLSVPVTTGIDPLSLERGVGHVNGTAMPGGLGTLGLAGHRDTYLRALRDVSLGMDIRVVDATGVYHYIVDSTEIVLPEQVSVLAIQSRPELTLITCYPFNYVGAAPKRFIVHAHLVSVAPDRQG